MPSTTLKRTAATLGVLAGLLATAGPASAMPIYMKVDGVVSAAGTQFRGEVTGLEPTMNAPASPTSEVFTSVSNVAPLHGDVSLGITQTSRSNSLELENTMISGYSVKAAAPGTQVGSEGVSDGRKPQGTYDQPSPLSSLDTTAQGIIMSDGRICNPRWGC
jgi:hypothetical protein